MNLRYYRAFILLGGLLSIPAFTLQPNLAIRAVQALSFILLSAAVRVRIRLIPSLLVAATIIIVHLLNPSGRVLLRLAGIPVTAGALGVGLEKAILIVGLVYLSKFWVRPHLRSQIGGNSLLALVFSDFDRLTRGWREIREETKKADKAETAKPAVGRRANRLISKIDALLMRVYLENDDSQMSESPEVEASPLRAASFVAIGAAQWALFFIGRSGIVPDFF